MKKIAAIFTSVVSAILGKARMKKLLIYSAKTLNINLHEHGLIQIGAYISHVPEKNGEVFLIELIFPHFFRPAAHFTFFDFGSIFGHYAIGLENIFLMRAFMHLSL